MRGPDEVVDHKITVIGPDIDGPAPGFTAALHPCRRVAGKKMQAISSRSSSARSTTGFNYIEGRHAHRAAQPHPACGCRRTPMPGLRIKDFGEVLYHEVMDEFSSVADKCQVTIYHRQGPLF